MIGIQKKDNDGRMDLNLDAAALLAKAFDDFKVSSDKLSSIYKNLYDYEQSSFRGDIAVRIDPAPMLATIEDIIVNLAHRMRSPLGAIQLLAELLMEDLGVERQEMVEDILIGVNSLDAVLSNLLSFAQPIKPNFQRVNILAAINESLLFAEPSIRQQRISLTRRYSDDEIFCQGDLEQLKQVYFNLILNAIQAMPEGGELHIDARYDHSDIAPIEKIVKVQIQDSGCGIANDEMNRVFTPFFTTKKDAPGLGLCIVYKIIQAHNGTIRIKSKTGQGTTVSVTLSASSDIAPVDCV